MTATIYPRDLFIPITEQTNPIPVKKQKGTYPIKLIPLPTIFDRDMEKKK